MEPEVTLHGGVANAGAVTRQGDHVLRPSNPHSQVVHEFLTRLAATGFDGASRPIGIDQDGRERLHFIEGQVPVPPFPAWARSDEALASIAELMRSFHDASATVTPAMVVSAAPGWSTEMADPAGGVVVCHNDVCLENVVFRDGIAVALIDFDFAAPGRPVHDLAQMARMCVPIDDDVNAERLGWGPADRPARLRMVADVAGLGSDGRGTLIEALDHSMAHGGDFVRRRVERGERSFIDMWRAMGGQERYDRRLAWWTVQREGFVTALS